MSYKDGTVTIDDLFSNSRTRVQTYVDENSVRPLEEIDLSLHRVTEVSTYWTNVGKEPVFGIEVEMEDSYGKRMRAEISIFGVAGRLLKIRRFRNFACYLNRDRNPRPAEEI